MEDWPKVSEIWENKKKKYWVYIVIIYEQWKYLGFRAFVYSTGCDKKPRLREQSIKKFLEQYRKVDDSEWKKEKVIDLVKSDI